MEYCPGGDLGK
jgi:serine/threonine protein kinase